jgi:hypothetical protein
MQMHKRETNMKKLFLFFIILQNLSWAKTEINNTKKTVTIIPEFIFNIEIERLSQGDTKIFAVLHGNLNLNKTLYNEEYNQAKIHYPYYKIKTVILNPETNLNIPPIGEIKVKSSPNGLYASFSKFLTQEEFIFYNENEFESSQVLVSYLYDQEKLVEGTFISQEVCRSLTLEGYKILNITSQYQKVLKEEWFKKLHHEKLKEEVKEHLFTMCFHQLEEPVTSFKSLIRLELSPTNPPNDSYVGIYTSEVTNMSSYLNIPIKKEIK